MRLNHHFDSGVCPPVDVGDDELRFDVSEGSQLVYVRVDDVPDRLELVLDYPDPDADDGRMVPGQGVFVATPGEPLRPHPVTESGGGTVRTTVYPEADQITLATRYPYGRDGLDDLLCSVADWPVEVRRRQSDGRTFPEFRFGDDDAERVHYVVAGEDAAETAGSIVADRLVRAYCADASLRSDLVDGAALRVVPLASPYSASVIASAGCRSYITPRGESIYGAATWRDRSPPPEYALLREQVTSLAEEGRLACCLTLHSWQGQQPYSSIQTIRTAGDNELSDERVAWANRVMETLTDGIPAYRTSLPDTIWHEGLARDYTLRELNVATFRTEITTHGDAIDGIADLEAHAERFARNLCDVDDWSGVYPS